MINRIASSLWILFLFNASATALIFFLTITRKWKKLYYGGNHRNGPYSNSKSQYTPETTFYDNFSLRYNEPTFQNTSSLTEEKEMKGKWINKRGL